MQSIAIFMPVWLLARLS